MGSWDGPRGWSLEEERSGGGDPEGQDFEEPSFEHRAGGRGVRVW